ncbi:MAG: hypothetical protein CFE44_01110 [Burkholderiales bacterium PBB4]|nr:MAG: hypothetical protein CFE44_01110 [Burkholderiales bacterium PBB4]
MFTPEQCSLGLTLGVLGVSTHYHRCSDPPTYHPVSCTFLFFDLRHSGFARACVALGALLLWCGFVVAQELRPSSDPTFPEFLVSQTSPGRVDTGPRMGVLVDAGRSLTIEAVMASGVQWQTIDRRSPNFGFTPHAYWFRFAIVNGSTGNATRYIEMPISFMDHVHLYHHAQGRKLQEYDTGDEQPFSGRPMVHQNFVMPVDLVPGVNQIHVRVANAGTVEAPLRIWEPASFQVNNQLEKLAQGMVIGVLLVMVLYNLFVFFGTREMSYLYYIGFALSYLLFQYSLTGYTYAYLWPDSIWWNSVAIPLFICTTEMTVALFSNHFLRVREYSGWVYNALRGLIWGTAGMAVLSTVLPYHIAIRIGAGLAIPTAAFCLAIGYWRWWKGDSFARLFCVAWSSALLGVMVLTAGKFGIVPANFWTENAGQIGILGLVVLLSFTLVDRINHDRSSRLQAQALALEHERNARASQEALIAATEDANRKLEQSVRERTTDLNLTLGQLQEANTQLQRLSMTDGLTKIGNRASFDQALATEFKRAMRNKSYLTLMLLDVDHFKRVNDTWGHLAGDACLRALAQLLQTRVHRTGDRVARYGGEEFVVMLGDSLPADAVALAETFREAIQALEIDVDGMTLRMTASFGVAYVVPDGTVSPHQLLAAADKALYEAKQTGRNRVCVAPGVAP